MYNVLLQHRLPFVFCCNDVRTRSVCPRPGTESPPSRIEEIATLSNGKYAGGTASDQFYSSI